MVPKVSTAHLAKRIACFAIMFAMRTFSGMGLMSAGCACDLTLVCQHLSRAFEKVAHGGARWMISQSTSPCFLQVFVFYLLCFFDHLFQPGLKSLDVLSVGKIGPPQKNSSGGRVGTPRPLSVAVSPPSPAKISRNTILRHHWSRGPHAAAVSGTCA